VLVGGGIAPTRTGTVHRLESAGSVRIAAR
jgi:hypothetical protein